MTSNIQPRPAEDSARPAEDSARPAEDPARPAEDSARPAPDDRPPEGGIFPGDREARGGTLKIPQFYKVINLRKLLTYT